MNLREYLEKYRTLTLELISLVQNDGEMECLLKEREEILKSINNLDFDREEIKKIGNSLNLLELEQELQNSLKREKVKVRQQIETLKKTKQANTRYNSFENKARVFNKSI